MVNLLAAALIAAASPSPVSSQAAAEPAMFVVHDSDTTIYLFGTFHALDGDQHWFDGGVRNAFEQSNELVLETLLPEGPHATQQLRQAMQAPSVKPAASFLATTRMAISASRAEGMKVDNGADAVLRHVAETEGKDVEELETLQFQLNMFNHLAAAAPPPGPAPAASQSAAPRPIGNLSSTMAQMQSAWKRGDQGVFVRMLDELKVGAPDTYRMMFTDRNARWADWIAARMQTPGTVFVAVGAGHLAGKDSVLVRLAEKGIESQRVY
jgi:uncharacterized protein YbaP (TraB family)